MQPNTVIKTERLLLRPWKEEDFEPFAKMNSDPKVMEHFPGLLSREESDQFAKECSEKIIKHGWGLWAVSLADTDEFIGYIGLKPVNFTSHFTPAVEIGWRLAHEFWGQGYATEGALAALQYGFETVRLNEIVSLTTVNNTRSRRVMEWIGMEYDGEGDFDHPRLPEDHRLRRHVLYRLKREDWQRNQKSSS